MKKAHTIWLILLIAFATSCHWKKATGDPMFVMLDADRTGLHFANQLAATDSFNVFKYMYFYNGAGIGAGDFNNDGLTDLFFASNQADNKLYLNKGKLRFEDATQAAQIPQDGGWSTGISVVDINNDGLLDIYVCKVGNYEALKSRNQLLVCQKIENGIPVYQDLAAAYGIDFSGFSTQAAFFDYDLDGDLDLFLLNHTVHQNGSFAERSRFLGTYDLLSGDRLYRNDDGRFTDVTRESGIHSSAISYGLGIAVSDIDLDGYPDLYIGNDFHENDYFYINQRNGRFKDETSDRLMHTSQFSMGVDVADITNDGFPEIISMDMLPSDPYILKRSLGEDEYNTFYMKLRYGYNYQYTRNNLQLNLRNGHFSEAGLYSGIAATDWSWAPLWLDFDNDGYKDLFVSNGIPKRLNDIDYVNYVSNENVQRKINANRVDEKEMAVIDKFPQIKIPNRFYRNNGQSAFEDLEQHVAGNEGNYSNGAIYADLDNDGDLDIVVNNIDESVQVYENRSNGKNNNNYFTLHLKGSPSNINAIGAKLILFSGERVLSYEKFPVRGFMSSMEVPLHVGYGQMKIDSCILVWPDNTWQHLQIDTANNIKQVSYRHGLPAFDYGILRNRYSHTTLPAVDITHDSGIHFLHRENSFNEFDREPLIPFMVSREGPALAVADINGDGLEDVFIGSAKREKSAVFLQQVNGAFVQALATELGRDSSYEDVDACWTDVNNDGYPDLVVASGGNEYYGEDVHLLPRVYLNDGKGNLKRKSDAFDVRLTASSLAAHDFNGDGYTDLFIGARAEPWNYGQVPRSYLLQNDGTGRFFDVTEKYSKDLPKVGLVKSAAWTDVNRSGKKDLVITTEWGGIYAFIYENQKLKKTAITNEKGWWNFALPVDVNGDGHMDFIAGNLGLNSRLKATPGQPVRLYCNDFDGNGKMEQVLTYYLNGKEIPFATKDELQKQMPVIKKKFLYAEDFAKASLEDLFGKAKLTGADILTATNFANTVFINDGKGNFTPSDLPWQAQLTSYKTAVATDVNHDGLPDVLMFGNFYDNNIQMGRYDADYGTVLLNRGNGKFEACGLSNLLVKGQVKQAKSATIGGKKALILARNNDSTMVIRF